MNGVRVQAALDKLKDERNPASPNYDAVGWLQSMVEFSGLTDCKPHFVRIAADIRHLRSLVAAEQETVS